MAGAFEMCLNARMWRAFLYVVKYDWSPLWSCLVLSLTFWNLLYQFVLHLIFSKRTKNSRISPAMREWPMLSATEWRSAAKFHKVVKWQPIHTSLSSWFNYTVLQCESLATARAEILRYLCLSIQERSCDALLVPHVPPRTDERHFLYTTSNSGVRTHWVSPSAHRWCNRWMPVQI
jgi:hypothetical protein